MMRQSDSGAPVCARQGKRRTLGTQTCPVLDRCL